MASTIYDKVNLHGLYGTFIISEKSKVNVSLAAVAKEQLPEFPKKRFFSEKEFSLSPQISNPNFKETRYVSKEGVLNRGIKNAIKDAAVIPRSTPFIVFNQTQMKASRGITSVLYHIFPENILTLVNYAKTLINEELLRYCLSVASRHRPDFVQGGIQIPSHLSTNPMFYSDVSEINKKLYTNLKHRESGKTEPPIEIEVPEDFTATNADPEHFIAYFREDIGVSVHHQHWHQVFPFEGPDDVVIKDRRGELFIYMHAQILARYNFERICAGLSSVEKLDNFREAIPEPYYPKIDEASKQKIWSPRQPWAQLRDVNRDFLYCEVNDLERWQERLLDAVDQGYVYKRSENGDNEHIKLSSEKNPIDGLGNTIEAVEKLSFNYNYYGNLHNSGHLLIAYCHDPVDTYKEPASIMAYNQANLRDPIFYRWHAYIDDIADRYRYTLTPYSEKEKQFSGIKIESLHIKSDKETDDTIITFWMRDRVDVSKGVLQQADGEPANPQVFVKFTHLQHKEFTYNFSVTNSGPKTVTAFVRIFVAPLHDETRQEMVFNRLRRYMIELDKFTVQLKSGKNDFTRASTKSSVTIPFDQMFLSYEEAYKLSTEKKEGDKSDGWCGCGWPQHLLVGRGTTWGTQCTLFAMLTNYDEDKAVQDSSVCCDESVSYCGVRSGTYPDKRPMGFPFDRPIGNSLAYLDEFMTESKDAAGQEKLFDNMKITSIKIVHKNETYDGKTIPQPHSSPLPASLTPLLSSSLPPSCSPPASSSR